MNLNEPTIFISKNGPYKTSGNILLTRAVMVPDESRDPVRWEEIKILNPGEDFWLCRCGHSKNKPYCDDSHLRVGFDGTETAQNAPYADMASRYSGPELEYDDVRMYCASARFCNRAGGIRKLVDQSDESEKKQIAIQEAFDCPAGRLVAIDKTTGKPMEPDFLKSISVVEDPGRNVSGPLWVKGGIKLVSEEGIEYEVRNRMALCRCGQSRNKPFCDGSHIRAGFQEEKDDE